MINKDTLLFGSFSKKAGNNGCMFFNTKFKENNVDAIYKSFSINNINDAINAAKCLNFSAFAVSMPFKTEIIKLLDDYNEIVKKTNSCNTVLIKNNNLIGYNTDYMAVKDLLMEYKENQNINNIYILGNGSYSGTVQVCCKELEIDFNIITRKEWNQIKLITNSFIFNCTPVEKIQIDESNIYIDCINTTETGAILSKKQANIQYELYKHFFN